MAAYTAFFLLILSFIPSSYSISCLVIRPGYGLVSEKCPPSAIGCRIRVMSDRIDWYEWAKLYDRNQLVCVYPEEYKTESGCQKKTSGSIRCWCGGKDDCNDAENSKDLYEEYAGRMGLKNNRVKISTTTPSTTTTTTRKSTPRKVTPKRIQIKTTATQRTTERTEEPTTTQMAKTTTRMAETKKFPDVEAHPLPTDDRDKYDEIFAETRRQLEEQMKEEDERLQTMLADEEEEMREEETTRTAEDENRLDRRERARQEERRRQEEEERLARMEREEAEESARQTRQREDEDEDEEEEEFEEFGMTSFACSHFSMPFVFVLLIR